MDKPEPGNGKAFTVLGREYVPLQTMAVGEAGAWVLAVEPYLLTLGGDVAPVSLIWRTNEQDGQA